MNSALRPTFEDLVASERSGMLRLAASLVDIPERAEEIVQDAFEKTLLAWRLVPQEEFEAVANDISRRLVAEPVRAEAVVEPRRQFGASPAR